MTTETEQLLDEINTKDHFISSFKQLQKQTHETAKDKGWWNDREKLIDVAYTHSEDLGKFAEIAIKGLGISLEHSELSEALEGIRHGNPADDKIPDFTSEEAESADVVIRMMDRAERNGLRLAEAIVAKMEMNKVRSFKYGGKLA